MEKTKDRNALNREYETEFLKDLIPDEARPYGKLRKYSSGELLIEQGEEPENLFCLVRGRCCIHMYLSNGRKMILSSPEAPCLLGEMEIFDMSPTNFSVEALEDSTVIALPLKDVRDILLENNRFLRQLCLIIADKERSNSKKLMHAGGFPLENRLAGFILANSSGIVFRIKKVEIAETLGVSYRHLEKVMSDFVAAGYLRKEKLTYYIEDADALIGLADKLRVS